MDVEFDEMTDDNDAICPYCGDRYQVESEDYTEDDREEKCDGCGKKYWLHEHFSVSHETRPDCALNGQQHKYEEVAFKSGNSAFFCTVCGHCAKFIKAICPITN